MMRTLAPTCAFCGLRFNSRPLLELHIREDHAQRDRPAEPGQADLDARTSGAHPDDLGGQPATPSPTGEAVTATGTRRALRPRTGWAMAALRRVASTFRRQRRTEVRP
jgi:hypothetical protein